MPTRVNADAAALLASKETGKLDGIRIVLKRGATVEGVVRNPDGTPAAHVRVGLSTDAYARAPDDDQAWVQADDGGRYRLTEADPAARLYIVALGSLSDWTPPVALAGRLAIGKTLSQDVKFETGARVELEVRVPQAGNGLQVELDGGPPSPLGQRDWTVEILAGPHRLRLKDAVGKVLGERAFVIPIGAKGYEVRFED